MQYDIKLSANDIALIQSALVTPQIRAVVDLSNRLETQARSQVEVAGDHQPEPQADAEPPSA